MLAPLLLLLLFNSLTYSQGQGHDIAHQVRGQAESLKEALGNLSNNPKANDVLRRIKTHTNVCFNTLDDVAESIETGTQLVENVAEDIEEILDIVKGFVTGTSESLGNTVKLMRAVDIIVQNLVPETSETCADTNNVDKFESIHSVGLIIAELARTDGLLDKQYQKTGDVLSKVADFLSEYSNPHYDCTGHQNIAIVKVVGPVIVDLAKLYRLVWGDNADQMTEFEEKIADNMNNIPGFKSTFLECTTLRSDASRIFKKLPPGTNEEKIFSMIFFVMSIFTVIIATVHYMMKVQRKRGRKGYEVI